MSGILATVGRGSQFIDLVLDISNTERPDIPALAQAGGWVGTAQKIRIVNNALVNTLTIPSSLAGADITLVNAAGARIGGSIQERSTALTLRAATKIENLGTISGHGGYGGTGATAWISRVYSGATQSVAGSGGGGGAGQGFSYGINIPDPYYGSPGYSGTTGTLGATGGFGGGGGSRGTASATGGNGGTGGSWGQAGSPGGVGSISGDYDTGSVGTPGTGNPPGHYIDGASFATWLATGTRLGLSK